MDSSEIIALGIVALAALLALRCFLGKKGGGCCGSDCPPGLDKKKDAASPPEKIDKR
jgi:hypothetical protein